MKMHFDEHGYLMPAAPIETDLDGLEATFVYNEHRRWLFEKLIFLLEKLIWLEIGEYIALFWVNGSFVTQKEMPRDIDVVVFINQAVFQKKLPDLRHLQTQLKGKVDFYFEPFYPPEHKLHEVFLMLKNDWQELYSHTRRHYDTQKIHRKGFLQINPGSIF